MKDSFKWSLLEKLGQYIVQIIISILLARILPPEDFGNIALLNVIVILCNTVVDAGFSQGLIRKLDCSHEDYNSVFWFNLLISIFLYLILFFCAPIISWIFNNDELTLLSRYLFLTIPIGALNIIQLTQVSQNLNFRRIAILMIAAATVSGTIGLVLAFSGYGIWSMVIQLILNSALITCFIWLKSDWSPQFTFSLRPIKELFPFSSKLLISTLLNNLFNNIYIFVIGRLYSPIQLGYYSQAYRYSTQPGVLLDSVLTRMAYPTLSKLQYELVTYREVYKKIQKAIIVIILPTMIYTILVANELIMIILGPKWTLITPYFQLLCVATITLPIHPLTMSTLKIFGLSSLILKLEIVKKILIVALVALSISYGLIGLVIGQMAFFLLVLPVNMYYSGAQFKYTLYDQLKDLIPFLYSVILTTVLTLIIDYYFIYGSPITIISLKFICFFALYLSFLRIFVPTDIRYAAKLLFGKK